MKIQVTKSIVEKIMELHESRELSNRLNALLTNRIAEGQIIPGDAQALMRDAILMKKKAEKQHAPALDEGKTMLMLEIMDLLAGQFDDGTLRYLMKHLVMQSRVFQASEFAENPYLKNIHFQQQEMGDFVLAEQEFLPWELDIWNIPVREKELQLDIPRISCFSEKYVYPSIFQKSIERTWMSITPNEIFTMESPIRNAYGKVLTLGCGMGYFAYMASRKENVASVTIIEKEQNVIDLFEKLILPQMETKDRIQIVKADALDYLKELEDGQFDYCFADIWPGVDDFETWIRTREAGRRFRKMRMEYWIDESFAFLLSAYAYMEILESFSEANHIPVPSMDEFPMPEEEKRKSLYVKKLLEKESITRPDHIDYYLNPVNMLSLIARTDILYDQV